MNGKNYLKNTKMSNIINDDKMNKENKENPRGIYNFLEKDELAERYYAILEEMLKETINC